MFPGQSSFHPRVLADAGAWWPDLTDTVLHQAEHALGRDLTMWRTEATDARNEDLQLAVFLANHIHLLAFRQLGVEPDASLGLSLGELNHVVEIGAIGFEDAVRLVSARGRAYDDGPSGAMAAVFPVEADELAPLLPEGVDIVGFNAPTQHVIAGAHAPMQAALQRIEDETYARVVTLQSRLPMHHGLFASVSRAFTPALEAVPWRPPTRAYRPNATAEVEPALSGAMMAASLAQQVCRPVRWRTSIDRVAAEFADVTFVEVGPGTVLVNLLRPKWRPEPRAGTRRLADVEALVHGA
jgi:[acyl-carrier-protein] S-malonyltransferase